MSRFAQLLMGSGVATVVAIIGIALFKPGPPPVDMSRWDTVEEPTVSVKFGGISPKEVRAYAPAAGTKVDLRLTIAERAHAGMAGETLFELDAEAVVRVRGKVASIADDGAIEWTWKVRGVEVTKDTVGGNLPPNSWRAGVKDLKGLKGRSWLDGQGYVLGYESWGGGNQTGINLAIEVERMLREPVPHLPDSPIGERAEWVVKRVVKNDGVPTELRERWKLVSISDDGWVLEATVAGSADADAPSMDLPGFEAAVAMDTNLEGGGAFDLDAGALWLRGEAWTSSEGGVDPGIPELRGAMMRVTTEGDVVLEVE